MDRDYIVIFDENGQPYIEHISWGGAKSAVRGAASRAHKYIEKWGEGAKARYFYTKEELDAAMGRGRDKVGQAAGKVKSAVSGAAKKVGTTAQSGAHAVLDKTGVLAKQQRDIAVAKSRQADYDARKATEARDKAGFTVDTSSAAAKANTEAGLAKIAADKAIADYGKTPLGKIESFLGSAPTALKEAASKTGDKIKDAADTVIWNASPGYRARERMKAAKDEYDTVIRTHDEADKKQAEVYKTMNDTKSTRDSSAHASAAYDKAVSDARKNLSERDYIKELREEERAADAYWKAREAYGKTTLSKVEAFLKDPVGKIGDAAWSIGYDVKQAVSDVKDTVKIKAAEAKVASVEKLAEKYKAPVIKEMYRLDKGTGKTAKATEMYDRYMGQAANLLSQMQANAARGIMPTKEQIAEVKLLYERSIGK